MPVARSTSARDVNTVVEAMTSGYTAVSVPRQTPRRAQRAASAARSARRCRAPPRRTPATARQRRPRLCRHSRCHRHGTQCKRRAWPPNGAATQAMVSTSACRARTRAGNRRPPNGAAQVASRTMAKSHANDRNDAWPAEAPARRAGQRVCGGRPCAAALAEQVRAAVDASGHCHCRGAGSPHARPCRHGEIRGEREREGMAAVTSGSWRGGAQRECKRGRGRVVRSIRDALFARRLYRSDACCCSRTGRCRRRRHRRRHCGGGGGGGGADGARLVCAAGR